MHSTKQFWDWFKKNNKAYLFLEEVEQGVKEQLLNDLLEQLHQYCDKLFFEIGGFPGADQELIITAEGDADYFEQVETLVAAAPKIDNWSFIAFIPPREIDFDMNYEGVILKPSEMWFLPLENPKDPTAVGLRICTMNYELIKDHEWLNAAVYKTLDVILGEKSFAQDIDYLEIKQLPDEPDEKGMLPLSELPNYVTWKKSKR